MKDKENFSGRVIIVVLGDIGHSPRMCYHAVSLSKHQIDVELVGYLGSSPHSEVSQQDRIRLIGIPSPIVLPLPLRFLWLTVVLFWALLFKTSWFCDLLLVQNPPGVPTLALCWFFKWLKGARLVIDWHNYTGSILEQKCTINQQNMHKETKNNIKRKDKFEKISASHTESFQKVDLQIDQGSNSLIAKVAYWFETFFGRRADWNLCVSNKMQTDLRDRWSIRALTLHDKAPEWVFRPLPLFQKHAFFLRLLDSNDTVYGLIARSIAASKAFSSTTHSSQIKSKTTLFTESLADTEIHWKEDRPLLLVSATSWTPDEDFQLLLDALRDFDKHVQNAVVTDYPKLLVIITGKGPLKAYYEEKISNLRMQNVHIVTAWLPAEDYPKLLACADLGVSLHTSTSGLDLPMKVVDMLGCHVPVLAKRFPAIDELVLPGTNGILFDTSHELRQNLIELSHGFPNGQILQQLKESIGLQLLANWDANWEAVAWPLLQKIFSDVEE